MSSLSPRLITFATLLVAGYSVAYPGKIELSGDQTAQVEGAESLLRDGTYRVSLHDAYGSESTIEIGHDYRQPLRWFPPGYSLLLYGLCRLGFSLAAAALTIHYALKLLLAISWLAVGRLCGIDRFTIGCAVAFTVFLTYPSTTTDVFESLAAAIVFRSLAENKRWISKNILLTYLAIAFGVVFRWAAIKLAIVFPLLDLARKTTRPRVVAHAIGSIGAILAYGLLCWFIVGEPTPYHGVGHQTGTDWLLLPKGLYYAATGGWSPAQASLKPVLPALLLLALAGTLRMWRLRLMPPWVVNLLGFQMCCFVFLIAVQWRYGSMYGKVDPAFATARFYTLAQPLSIAFLMVSARMAIPRLEKALWVTVPAILVVLLSGWILQNRQTEFELTRGPDGFLRTSEVDMIHRELRAENPVAVFNGIGVFAYTGFDAARIYPSNIRGLSVPKRSKVAIVRWIERPNRLLFALGRERIAPIRVVPAGQMEAIFFDLPEGFHLSLTP